MNQLMAKDKSLKKNPPKGKKSSFNEGEEAMETQTKKKRKHMEVEVGGSLYTLTFMCFIGVL